MRHLLFLNSVALLLVLLFSFKAPGCAHARNLEDDNQEYSSAYGDLPENLNGIGDIKVFTYGDDNDAGKAILRRIRTRCSSTATLLVATIGGEWSWHEKLNRLLPRIRYS
jgi:hypothetical protein